MDVGFAGGIKGFGHFLLFVINIPGEPITKSLRWFGDPGPEFQKIIVLTYKIEECESVQQMNNCLFPIIKEATKTVFGTS